VFEAVQGKRLWQSEYGENEGNGLRMAENLNKDMHELHPTAWLYWQIVDEAEGWGLLQAHMRSENPSIEESLQKINTKWYVLAQYSRHIREGMVIIESGRDDTIAAYDRVLSKVVLVVATYEEANWVTFDLSKFNWVGDTAKRWCTAVDSVEREDKYGRKDDVHFSGKTFTVSLEANSVQTFEIAAYLEDVPDAHHPDSDGESRCLCQ